MLPKQVKVGEYSLLPINRVSKTGTPLEDLRDIKKSALGMNHLHDLAKDHLFLETFQVEEERAHEENLWYG